MGICKRRVIAYRVDGVIPRILAAPSPLTAGYNDGTINNVAKFPDMAWPRIALQFLDNRLGDNLHSLTSLEEIPARGVDKGWLMDR